MKGSGGNSSKTTGVETEHATTISVVEEAGNASPVGDNGAHSDGRSRKNKCGDGAPTTEGRVGVTQPICHRSRQGEELLCLQRVQVYGPTLPEQGAEEWSSRGKKVGIWRKRGKL